MDRTEQDFPQLLKPVDFGVIRSLTAFMQTQISAGTTDATYWDAVRVSKLAARMYAPLGTQMALSDFVRVWRIFADIFSGNKGVWRWGICCRHPHPDHLYPGWPRVRSPRGRGGRIRHGRGDG